MSRNYIQCNNRTYCYMLAPWKQFRGMNWQRILTTSLSTVLVSISSIVMSNNALSMEMDSSTKKIEISKEFETIMRKQGQARVIVGLKIDFKPEGELATSQDIAEQQSKISMAQKQLVSEITNYLPLEEKIFATIPYLAVNVNQAVLNLLMTHSLVKTIQLDETTSLSVPNNNMEVIQ